MVNEKNLTLVTLKYMGMKDDTSTLNQQQMYQAEGDFNEVFNFLNGVLNTGKQVDTKTITDLYKVMGSMESGGTYDNIKEFARLSDSVKQALLSLKQAQDYTLEIMHKYGIGVNPS